MEMKTLLRKKGMCFIVEQQAVSTNELHFSELMALSKFE